MTDEQRAALNTACPYCRARPGHLCTSHSGTRIRRDDVHRDRLTAHRATRSEGAPRDDR